MESYSSILAWRIPWTEEPGGLWSIGSQRVGHDWVTKHSTPGNNPNIHQQMKGWTRCLYKGRLCCSKKDELLILKRVGMDLHINVLSDRSQHFSTSKKGYILCKLTDYLENGSWSVMKGTWKAPKMRVKGGYRLNRHKKPSKGSSVQTYDGFAILFMHKNSSNYAL